MMSGVNSVNNNGVNNLEQIKRVFATELEESQRSTFDFTFNEIQLGQNKPDDKIYNNLQKYYDGLLEHKEALVEKLNITPQQYDAFACIALSLASQETGFGYEVGYEKENDGGFDDFARNVATWFRDLTGGGSASSGLTQMRLNDFIDGKQLSKSEKEALELVGAQKGFLSFGNNLYENPSAAAGATVVVLKSIWDEYENFKSKLDEEHIKIEEKLATNIVNADEASQKGNEIVEAICNIYNNEEDSHKQSEVRHAFYYWVSSTDGSKIGDKVKDGDNYNEEANFNKLQKIFEQYGYNIELDENSLDCVRYVMTDTSGNSEYFMNEHEYCAYAWNNGVNTESANKIDRIIAANIRTMLVDPEDFDYDYFTSNVSALAYRYAAQFNQIDDLDAISEEEKQLGEKFIKETLAR
ncbi:MAG: hypothetical protein IKL52_04810 [Candidatus Gastranaerophilales bacterium]|nr:hypothetical protein [Candidatus Gastranaerophilales bacterium]